MSNRPRQSPWNSRLVYYGPSPSEDHVVKLVGTVVRPPRSVPRARGSPKPQLTGEHLVHLRRVYLYALCEYSGLHFTENSR
jgi:hypothetical protein